MEKIMGSYKGVFEIGNDVREDNFSVVKGGSSYGCEEKGLILNVFQKQEKCFLKGGGGMMRKIWLSVAWLF